MAYSGKLASVRSVIESAYRDSGLDDIDYSSAIELTAELMGLLGVPEVYVTKYANNIDGPVITVENFRAKLPDDMVELTDMRRAILDDNGKIISYVEMTEASDLYHGNQNDMDNLYPNTYQSETSYPINTLNEYDELETTEGKIVGPEVNGHHLPSTYKVDANFIFTNFKDGYIEMVYKGYPLDEDGFPMIPDDEKFKAALKYEIIFKLDWKKWRQNPSPQNKSIANDSERRRDFYVAAARTKARIPNIGQMESLKNQWLRTIPKMNQHADGFKTNNIQEMRSNNSRFRKSRRR